MVFNRKNFHFPRDFEAYFPAGQHLEESYAEQMFNRSVAEMESWLDRVLMTLNSVDDGHDVASVSVLVKKHQLLEVEVQMQQVSRYDDVSSVCDVIIFS